MSNQTKPAALIIPALDEEESLGVTLSLVPPNLFRIVIVADNGSTDRTAEVARTGGALIVHEPERGYGAACLRALAALPDSIEAVAFVQADASENPAEAGRLLTPIFNGCADLVIGSRKLGVPDSGSMSTHQAWGNRLVLLLIRLLHGRAFTDIGPFRAIRVDALRRLRMEDRNFGWTVEMQVKAVRLGLRVVEVPVSYHRRAGGKGKVSATVRGSLSAGFKMVWTALRLVTFRPEHRP